MFTWEANLLENLLQDLGSFQTRQGHEDQWVWDVAIDGIFSVKSAYETQFLPNVLEDNALFNKMWATATPSKALAFS